MTPPPGTTPLTSLFSSDLSSSKKHKKSDRPLKGSVQGLPKAKKLFLPCFFFDFWPNTSEKLRAPLNCHGHGPFFACFPRDRRLVFLDINPKTRNKPAQSVLHGNIGKTAISCFFSYIWDYSGHTNSKSEKLEPCELRFMKVHENLIQVILLTYAIFAPCMLKNFKTRKKIRLFLVIIIRTIWNKRVCTFISPIIES